MRLLTFNLWHGLSPTSPIMFEPLEPSARLSLREELQIHAIAEAKPDLCFLQEVNPVTSRMEALKDKLRMEGECQPDLAGVKVFGMGVPVNLHSGLGVLADRRYGLKLVEAVSLSRPSFNWVRTWASWQLKEERFALFCETLLPGWGKVLLINTHLHHGLECDDQICNELDELAKKEDLNAAFVSEVRERLQQGNFRRESEITVLVNKILSYAKRYSAVVLCGDFNATPASPLFSKLREIGFRDAWEEAHPQDPGYTFDPENNPANHVIQSRFMMPNIVLEDLTFSAKVKESLIQLTQKHERRPRRIDYVWFRSPTLNLKVKSAELIGKPNSEGLAPSDHFGVCVDLEVE